MFIEYRPPLAIQLCRNFALRVDGRRSELYSPTGVLSCLRLRFNILAEGGYTPPQGTQCQLSCRKAYLNYDK